MAHSITPLDRISRVLIRGIGALPAPVKRRIAGRPIRIDGQELNLEAQVGIRLLNLAVGETFETMPVERGRAQLAAEAWVFGSATEVGSVENITLNTRDGSVPARVYRPHGCAGHSPALVYFHGGGWVLGDLGAADAVSRFLCDQAQVTVVSVDYRLAPEHRFPAAVHDAIDSYQAVVDRGAELGIDPTRVAVGGESAGGNLSAVVAQHYRGEALGELPAPAFQLLLMPVTDLTAKRRSYALFSDGFFLSEAQMDWYKNHYLGEAAEAFDPRVSPILAKDLAGCAPAFVAVAGFDVLRDEGAEYAARLAEAGVPTALRCFEGITHGLVNATGVGRVARDTLLEAAGALRVGLAPGRTNGPGNRRSAGSNDG